MSETLRWWVMTQVVAFALLPLALALFHRLPDRGYTLAKPFALLLVGYVFWILNVIGILPNSTGGIWGAIFLLMIGSGIVVWRQRDELVAFARDHIWLILVTEAIFFLAFITAAYLRSYVGDIIGTEQPMDFMFLNAVTRADSYPPQDPWLAGENVSYYYFGYLIVSIITRLSAVATSVGYNLGLAMIVALSATAVFGLVYNLATLRSESTTSEPSDDVPARPPWRPMAFGVVAALLLAAMGNLEGILEWLASSNIGSAGFYRWLDVNDASGGGGLLPYNSEHWYPDQFWFWFRATRVIQVSDGLWGIHEFPFFSFLLGDMHPHVMSIPFILLALGGALALLRSESPLDLVYWLERPLWLPALAIMLGALAFINTWDMPTIAFVLFLVALVHNRLNAERWSWWTLVDTLGFVLPLFIAAFLAYTPFFFGGFDSQAAGFTADWRGGTRLFHALLVWGPFALLVLPYAVWRLSQGKQHVTLQAVLWSLAPAVTLLGLWVVWDGFAKILDALPKGIRLNEAEAGLWTRIGDRGFAWFTVLFVGASLGLLILALVHEVAAAQHEREKRLSHVYALALAATAALLILGSEFFFIQDGFNSRMNTVFKLYYQAWLLLSIAGGFVLYELASSFRMPALSMPRNVVFEPSLGGWSWGELAVVATTLAGAIAGIVIVHDTPALLVIIAAIMGAGLFFAVSSALVLLWRASDAGAEAAATSSGALSWRAAWSGAIVAVLLAAFTYPVLASFERTNNFNNPLRTLDGLDYLKRSNPDEFAAIEWLRNQGGQPVVAQAVGDSYQDDKSRVAGATGLPTILGWMGHERQWHGDDKEQIGRPEDLQTLYTSTDLDQVRSVLEKYHVKYVFLSPVERTAYGQVTVEQFSDLFEQVFMQGDVAVYRVNSAALGAATRG
ncbi:MAG: DUF2298 domain-containing protein [Dehalococcoidia bacterium]